MSAPILIVGQGLAGTLLAWEFEQAGIRFEIVDAGHQAAASRVAAGIINPITGQRIVKSWRVDALLPVARESYRALEAELGLPLWSEMKVRRLFLNEGERRVFAEKRARGELGNFAGVGDNEGFWIEGAARVDVGAMISAARARWMSAGVMREARFDFSEANGYDLVIDCTGGGGGPFEFVGWQYSKGECLNVAIEGLAVDVVLNRGHWILPLQHSRAMIGATHVPGCRDVTLTPDARNALEASLRAMTPQPYVVIDQQAGVRTYLADKRPVVGRHPEHATLGIVNGLGAKGALFAPALARQWVNHLRDGVPFDSELDVARFWRSSRASLVSAS